MVKIEETYCPSYFRDIFGCWPCVYTRDFYWVHACHPLFKDYPQVIHGRRMERAFLRFEVKVMVECDLENVSDRCYMSGHVGACCNANVVHVYPYGGSSEFVFEDGVSEDVVHHCLKCRQGIGESEVHDRGFKKSVPCFERCLPFISFLDAYVVVSPSNIKFRIYVSFTEVPYEVRDKGQWVLIVDSDCVDLPVVLYWSQLSIFLLDVEERGCVGGFGWSYVSLLDLLC